MFDKDPSRPIKVVKSLPSFIEDRLPDSVTDENERRAFFMNEALKMARTAAEHGDIPVGCVIVRHNEIIAAAENRREADKNALAHAEALAIEEACKALGGWRLVWCEMYVTLEPCPMCAGAIVNARVPKVYIGAAEKKSGAFGGLFNLFDYEVNHKPQLTTGVLENECAELLQSFFKNKRQ